jgi:hypothetical protein
MILNDLGVIILAYDKWVGGGLVALFMVLIVALFHFELEHRRSFKARAMVIAIFFIVAVIATLILTSYISTG